MSDTMTKDGLLVKYGLPAEVKFCKKCVLSNQRPQPKPEIKYTPNTPQETTFFDEEGVCSACRYAEMKDSSIDWGKREKGLIDLLDRYRSGDGRYDCVVPGSGGKDSGFASHILKNKYGMHPLTVTWAPHIYSDIGWKNFQSWIHSGFDNILITPNGKVHSLLTKLAFVNLLHPFQPFVFGQRFAGLRIAMKFNIPLIFHGESPFEYGCSSLKETEESGFRKKYFCSESSDPASIYLGGVSVKDLVKEHGLDMNDLAMYMPLTDKELGSFPMEYKFLGYYIKWDPQEAYYYAVENTGFEGNVERTEGTYSKYASIDDKTDPFHYYTSYIKFGLGRATMDAAQEIRNHKINREEGVALVRKYDHEFPSKFYGEFLHYMGISEEMFLERIDSARSPHLWVEDRGTWKLRHAVFY
ncbi:MAG: N-acetyl sugar amidotransferase [Candidatus Omnitrophica bacterium]|nr:N-acetyl sugar amidotransferase [Candidatus Omnitrophota bacterium]